MNIVLSRIKAYVPDLDVAAQGYTDAMTLTGTKVGGFTCLDKNLEKIVVGGILSVERHPDADELVVCQANVGQAGPIQIVTGAPNITLDSVGKKVPVVLDGGRVAGGRDGGPLPEEGIKIKKGELGGVESWGTMRSVEKLRAERETYPDAPESGIYILLKDSEPGGDTLVILGMRDMVFEYEITSNRVDYYSVQGIARKTAATFRKPFVPPVVTATGGGEDINDYLKVRVENTWLCPRYCARVVKNIKLAPSPRQVQRRLAASGIRPINSIVDIINYVIEEYGQLMHAFDYDQLVGHEIIVKCAKNGDVFQTLDGQERKLDFTILMVNDGEKEVGIIGIVGGENSRIMDDIKTMVFESVCFNGTNIRLSAKKVGLRTDASGKYEKGLDPSTAEEAINCACQLIEELGTGEVVGGIIDIYPVKKAERRIPFNTDKVNKLLGTDLPEEAMLGYFKTVELKYDPETGEVIAPTWRQDLERMTDLAKEVARFYGYDKIPTTFPSGEATTGKLSYKLRIEEITREIAQFHGFSQGMIYSFESPRAFDKMLIPADSRLRMTVNISNPLGEDFSVVCTSSLNGMLTSLLTNYNRRNKDVRLYELTNIHRPKVVPLTELPGEHMQSTLGMYEGGDLFTMKSVVEEFFKKTGVHKKSYYDPNGDHSYLHPGRKVDIVYDGRAVGFLGEVHPDVADNYKIGDRAHIAVIGMSSIMELTTFDREYSGIARFPAVTRDISMVVPKDILVGQIEDVVGQREGKSLESYKLFDVYGDAQVLSGCKSVACFITFRAKDHTLEDKEVTAIISKVLNKLGDLGIELRA